MSIPELPPILLDTAVNDLHPLFLQATGGDQEAARTAARAVILDMKPTSSATLLLATQLIGFTLAALASLRDASQPGLSPTLAMRLRANANALLRSADRCRKALHPAPPPKPAAQPKVTAVAKARPVPQPPPALTAALENVARQHGIVLPALPAAPTLGIRAAALASTAHNLGLPPPHNQPL